MTPSRIPAYAMHVLAACGLGALVLAHAAGAQTPAANDSDFDLLIQQQAPPPNIAVLLDDSGSMSHIAWDGGFDSKVFYDSVAVRTACPELQVDPISGSAGLCPGSGNASGLCPNSENHIFTSNPRESDPDEDREITCLRAELPSPAAGICSLKPDGWGCSTTSTEVTFTLPDVSVGTYHYTRYSVNYLAYLIGGLIATGNQPVVSALDRLEVAKDVLEQTINAINPGIYNENARFALFGFDSQANGASLKLGFTGASATALNSAINGMRASGWTPLAESLVDIGRYMSGNLAIGEDADLTAGPLDNNSPMDDAYCARNFVLILTDGEPTQDQFDHAPFSGTFLTAIGDADGSGQDPDPPAGVPPYANNGSDWLDDVAYFLARNDLRPEGMVSSGALAETQNIVTYVVGFNVDHPLLASAAMQGDGSYFVTSSASDLAGAITDAINDILARSASFSAASIPSTRTQTGDALFTAFFHPDTDRNFWEGHLQAYEVVDLPPATPGAPDDPDFTVVGTDGQPAVDPTTGQFIEPRDTYFWDASLCLSDPNASCYTDPRTLYHNIGEPEVRTVFDPNQLVANDLDVTAADLTFFPNYPAVNFGSDIEALANAVVNYVRGEDAFDADLDGDFAERRGSVLGDVFHSAPLALGGPSTFLAQEEGFGPLNAPGGFFSQYYARDRVVYAGANDGMLHAFDAGPLLNPNGVQLDGDESYGIGTGAELFGYVPREALGQLKNLAKLGVAKPLFVDGSPVSADVWLPSGGASDVTKDIAEWTTVLLTGMRNGGASVLALDVTDPGATGGPHGPYPKLLWEFNDPNEPLGNTWSTPVITRVKLKRGLGVDKCGVPDGDGATPGGSGPDCRESWVAIFGGGYLKQGDSALLPDFIADPNDPNWVEASRSIFIVDIESGDVLARASYDASDPQLQYMTYSLPSTPAVADLDFDGFADVVYIGDLGGQMWKWDISAVAEPDASGLVDLADWPVGRFFAAPAGSNGHFRQIFYPPSLSIIGNDLTVAFGTGERTLLDYDAAAGVDDNHYYVVRDRDRTGPGSIPTTPYSIADLTLLAESDDVDPNPADLGFYIATGDDQKFVTDSIAFGGFVVTLSYDPELGASTGPCDDVGASILYVFSLSDGAGLFAGTGIDARRVTIGGGLPTSPRISALGASVNIVVQTSSGSLLTPKGPENNRPPVEWLYWRQM